MHEAQPLISTDEDQALLARERYRDEGLPEIRPDELVAQHLWPGERVLEFRAIAAIHAVDASEYGGSLVSDEGSLYVTDQRLLHIGLRVQAIGLAEINELAMADDRILVALNGAHGVVVDVEMPHQFRALIAAAKAALRAIPEA